MKKPEKQIIEYYDWDEAWKYLEDKYGFSDDVEEDKGYDSVWMYLVDYHEIHNGKIFVLSNWDLVYENGKFADDFPEWFIPILEAIMDEFGEIDIKCLTPGTKTCNFSCSW